ncbi:tyrosine-type recombinase/integrase [Magnetofaba australis]|uniref:Putative tyrosine recombinase n=1 Tax=Magnetofaba australis IT-1 TaxID=1434232 RepID=A0A1Y2K9S7_9PROT|nr:site-specific integrase [Magnetofaba australis]OSM07702.1 putative tyrosine recombinase [Magnetofaba australis IT-1]
MVLHFSGAIDILWLEEDELARLLEQAGEAPHLLDFIRLMVNTGLRPGEALNLRWDVEVNLPSGLIALQAEKVKSGKGRHVPINAAARAALLSRARFRAQYCPGSPWVFCHPNGERIKCVKKSFATAVRRARIDKRFTPHGLRHHTATALLRRGVSPATIQKLLGHADIATTMGYAHVVPQEVEAALLALENPLKKHLTLDAQTKTAL